MEIPSQHSAAAPSKMQSVTHFNLKKPRAGFPMHILSQTQRCAQLCLCRKMLFISPLSGSFVLARRFGLKIKGVVLLFYILPSCAPLLAIGLLIWFKCKDTTMKIASKYYSRRYLPDVLNPSINHLIHKSCFSNYNSVVLIQFGRKLFFSTLTSLRHQGTKLLNILVFRELCSSSVSIM